uniref:Regulator Ustilago maydis 1 protein n=1 Tax=Ganoderma boninense TaxID=34458 RepID=A0A5K1K5Z9_9APHY|nr:Regulator Ustilago maydis 1 protein [Ganoderma boninense]
MGLSEPPRKRRMHTLKRRKLTHSTSANISDSSLTHPNPPQLGTNLKVVCTSCHRAFPGAKQNQLVQCARCHAPTCTICSRTCNGCPPSVPPTPELTMSPATLSPATPAVCSPDTPASLSLSGSVPFANLDGPESLGPGGERRPALASHTNVPGTGAVGRRRKNREHDDVDEEGWKGAGEAEDERMRETGILPGCGRVVCRGCSFETPERYGYCIPSSFEWLTDLFLALSDLNTCYDCAGRSSSPIQS